MWQKIFYTYKSMDAPRILSYLCKKRYLIKHMLMKPTILGAGVFNFDTIIRRDYPESFVPGKRNRFTETVVDEEIGGTCGNVMCLMAYFGWHAYPIARFDDSLQGMQSKIDLERYGCDTRFVTCTPEGGTNLLTITHQLDKDGKPCKKHSRRHAPGSGFPRDKTILKNEAADFLAGLDFTPDIFFYDDAKAGLREIGQELRKHGTLVFFEPGRINDGNIRANLNCMKASDIIKFSDENVKDVSFSDELSDKLVIQTMGSEGVRFRLHGGSWIKLAPVVNEHVVDTDGCGDWTSAAFIAALSKHGCLKYDALTEDIVMECLSEAQEYASRNVEYMGTKGIIAANSQERMSSKNTTPYH